VNISRWSRIDTRWYLAVRCEQCQLPILFALDRSEGANEGQPPPAGKLVLTCTLDECRHKADYTTAAVLRFQKQTDETNETRRNHESGKDRRKV
jgi:hypothetical protein